MADMHGAGFGPGNEGHRITFAGLTNIVGAVTSLALVGGIAAWGYGMVMRDVSGVPVVRALEGPMREAPEVPGGEAAAHQGLSVNKIAAEGMAAGPPDKVIIAPSPLDLLAEDVIRTAPVTEKTAPASNANSADIHLAVLREDGGENLRENDVAPKRIAVVGGGIGRSLRPPRVRPDAPNPVDFALAAVTSAQVEEVDPKSLPLGTQLAQLGAYDSPEVARTEWQRVSATFGDLLEGKSRVVQKAESGGRNFYRLRVVGFEDLADARRFCSALKAENADCIPAVAR